MKYAPGDRVRVVGPQGHWANGRTVVIEEIRSWGIIGMVLIPGGDAPIRLEWHQLGAKLS